MTKVMASSAARGRLALAAGLPLLAHGLILGTAWAAGRLFGTDGQRSLGAAVVTFGVLELGLALVCITLTVVHQERQQRPLALAVSSSWLLGAFLVGALIGFAPG